MGGSVTVHYQDETGKQLAPDQILTGNVGEGYLTQEVALAGYKLTQRPANATGFIPPIRKVSPIFTLKMSQDKLQSGELFFIIPTCTTKMAGVKRANT
ncbi:MucBP domain-containing protein [Lactobacillus sp. R2/2]|nr:MucBP domain-containing protein [Lactobacillus sp. R2/2]MEB3365096.1 MucBP domain-containing protein [Lactobacillus sp. R2/2]